MDPGPHLWLKGSSGIQMGPRMQDGRTGAGVWGQSEGRRLSVSLGKYDAVFQAEIYAILACVYEIQNNVRSDKYVSTCSDSQAALEALQAVNTTSPLVRQCQRVLDDISTYHSVGLFWVPGHSGVRGNEIADELARARKLCSPLCWTGPGLGGLTAEHKKQNAVLVGQTALGTMAGAG
jgi:ribonuclease HI